LLRLGKRKFIVHAKNVEEIVITGQLRHGRYLVRVDGVDAWLTRVPFGDFCKLAAACLRGDGAGVEFVRKNMERLRNALSKAVGDDEFGSSLIVPVGTGKGTTRYVLARQARVIHVTPAFRHILLSARLDRHVADQLLVRCTGK
jgi:hypothetical protein